MSRSSRVLLSLPLLLLPSCQNGFPMESWDIEDKASVPFHFSFRRSLQNPPTSCNSAAEGHNIDTCQDPRNATVIAPFHQTAFAAHEEGAEGRNGRPPKYRKIQQEDFQTISSDNMHQSLFMSALSAHPDRSLSLCWEQHCKLLPGVAGITAATVAKWTIDEVFSFVQTLTGCEDQAKLFKDEMIDGEAFLLLTQADIVKIMSVKLGPALKIYNAILMFKNADDTLK